MLVGLAVGVKDAEFAVAVLAPDASRAAGAPDCEPAEQGVGVWVGPQSKKVTVPAGEGPSGPPVTVAWSEFDWDSRIVAWRGELTVDVESMETV
jgi:hypothetical protein